MVDLVATRDSAVDGTTIANLNAQSTIRIGFISVLQQTRPSLANGRPVVVNGFATATFRSQSGTAFLVSAALSVGTCRSGMTQPLVATTGLDAGNLTVSGIEGPGDAPLFVSGRGAYFNQYDPDTLPSSAGVFTFKATGSTAAGQVGPFSTTVHLSKPMLTWTNQDAFASIAHDSPPTFKWSGGTPGSAVIISAVSLLPSGTGGFFACSAPVEAGEFTVPSYLMLAVPAGSGQSSISNALPIPFSAPNLDFATAETTVTIQVNTTFK